MDIISQDVESTLGDHQIIETVLSGSCESFELLMRRYNSRLYRICRSILKDHDEVLDVIQETYFRAFKNLDRFEHRSSFSTWLIKIAVHEALARAKHNRFIETN
ncbi:MAG TPA: sigma-70 family RNA polymerase sigma factor, partial [Acidobacteriota bacterium]|nr:sigma-70 family RNA polymerase sigma factor [Acidobacteriota bacterium]